MRSGERTLSDLPSLGHQALFSAVSKQLLLPTRLSSARAAPAGRTALLSAERLRQGAVSRVGSGIEDPAVVWTISQADWVGFIIPSARCTQAPGSGRQAVKKKRLKVNTKGIRSSMCGGVLGGGGRDVTFVTNLQDKG